MNVVDYLRSDKCPWWINIVVLVLALGLCVRKWKAPVIDRTVMEEFAFFIFVAERNLTELLRKLAAL